MPNPRDTVAPEKAENKTYEISGFQLNNWCIYSIADTVRRNLGMSTDIIKREKPYDKLEKGLLSGLPNEVDFAINVCTLLSNEGKHTLNVSHSPRLIEILMAHVGIFREGAGSLFTLHHEGWRPCTKRNFERVCKIHVFCEKKKTTCNDVNGL